MIRSLLVALALLQVGPSIISAVEIVKTADIPYAAVKGVEPKLLSLDVYAPKGAKNLPVVVYLHGGYWKAGDKGQVGRLPEFFGNAGYLLVSVNYRLSPAAKHPDHIQDVAKAVAWVHDNIAKHGGDPEQIYLTGHSAGAQLVALLGTDAKRLEEAGKSLKVLRAVVPFDSAAMDLREIAKNDRRADSPYRAAFGDKPEDWADASPIVHAEKGNGLPPFQIVVAYGPALANKKKGVDDFAAAIRKAGTRAEVLDASPFREHQSLMTEFGAPDDPVAKAVLGFLESVRTNKSVKGLGGETVLKLDGAAGADAVRKLEAYRVRAVMSQYDKNGDGKISKDEMKDQPFLFGQLDADKDGFVTAEEIAAYFRRTQAIAPAPKQDEPKKPVEGTWKPDDSRIGSKEVAYLDPEFLQDGHLAVFADQKGTVWVGAMDPKTGGFKSADGCEFKIDTNLSKWSKYSNGPEWGLDKHGPSVLYLKDDERGAGQLWRAQPPWDQPKRMQLTKDPKLHHWICMATVDKEAADTRVIAYRGKPTAAGNHDVWLDATRPDKMTKFTDRMNLARWAYNSTFITWAPKVGPTLKETAQVTLVDTAEGSSRVITDDAGHKIDPWLWQAPEYDGEWLLAVNIDGKELGIYRDLKKDGKPWQRIASIALPSGSPQLKSVEPVNGGRGAFGRSYFTAQAGDDKDADTSIWLLGFDPKGQHLVRRLDDGMLTAKKARRLDPESYIGDRELFVYYTLVGDGPTQLHRCRTGISKVKP